MTRSLVARRPTTLVVVSLGLVLAALPTFLVGGLAVQIRSEFGFSEAALGGAVTGSFLAAALAAPVAGPWVDRMGPRAAIGVGSLLSTVGLVGIGVLSANFVQMAMYLTVAAIAFAFTDPGLAVLISRTIPSQRQGFAFGLKEASIPVATLAAGLAVPAIALTVGWRWAFALGLIPLAGLIGLLPRIDGSRPRPSATVSDTVDASLPGRRAVLLVAAAAALSSAAASGVGVFLTESAVAMGMEPSVAGLVLATGSGAGILTRLGTGLYADRSPGPKLVLMSWMMIGGAVAIGLGALGTGPMLTIGAIGAFAGGWGWSGLLFLSLVRASPGSPGAGAAVGLSGLGVGNALGPLAFGLAAQAASFQVAWLGAAVAAAAGGVLMRLAGTRSTADIRQWSA